MPTREERLAKLVHGSAMMLGATTRRLLVIGVIVPAITLVGCRSKKSSSSSSSSANQPVVGATATIGKPPFLGGHHPVLSSDGGLVILESEALVSLDVNGKTRWERRPFKHDGFLVPLADGSVVLSDHEKHDLIAVDPATGADRWRVPVPRDSEGETTTAEAAIAIDKGATVVVALADARIIKINPALCPTAKQGCISPYFTLKNETLSSPNLVALPNGDLIVGESEVIRQFSPSGEARTAFHLRSGSAHPTALGTNGLAVLMDEDLMVFGNLEQCKISEPKKPIAFPRKTGSLYIKGEGDCAECVTPPSGCLSARPKLGGDLDSAAPLVLSGDQSIVVSTENGLTRLARDGKVLWQTKKDAVPSIGTPIEVGGKEIVAVASGVGDDLAAKPLRVVGLSIETGEVRWTVETKSPAGAIVSTDEVLLAANGPWLVAGYKTSVTWIRLSK
jgi:outer membrane protein assembly factor BamB